MNHILLYVRALAMPCGLGALALLVRIYNIELTGTVPDTYERLFDAKRIVAGEFPASAIYPPGAAFVIAPFFLVLPDTVATMQAVIIGSGVAIVVVGYAWVIQLTRDRFAASALGIAVALCPLLVYASRVAYFDMLNVLLIVVLLAVLPWLSRKNWYWFIPYGVLLATVVNIRPTNVALLPAIAFLWLATSNTDFNLRSIIKNAITPASVVAVATFLLLCATSIAFGEWFAQSSNSPGLVLSDFLPNLLFYVMMAGTGWLGLFLIAPFSLIGLLNLWRINRAHSIAFLYVILVWPVVHAPFAFTNYRYILPVIFLLLLLASVGLSSIVRNSSPRGRLSRVASLGVMQLAVLLISLQFVLGTGYVLAKWSQTASEYDAALAQELMPVIKGLDDGAILVSAVDRAFRDRDGAKSLTFLDLVDHHRAWGVDEQSLDYLRAEVSENLDSGRQVFYLYSHWEAGHDFLGDGIEQYDRFFDGLNEDFEMTERQRTTLKRSGYSWILYEVTVP